MWRYLKYLQKIGTKAKHRFFPHTKPVDITDVKSMGPSWAAEMRSTAFKKSQAATQHKETFSTYKYKHRGGGKVRGFREGNILDQHN